MDEATKEKIGKIDKIEQALRNAKGIEDYMMDMTGLCMFPNAKQPEKFKMPRYLNV